MEWDESAAFTNPIERKHFLEHCCANPKQTRAALIKQFLKPPLYSQQYLRGFGTLYTAAYDLDKGRVQIIWPDKQVEASFRKFEEQEVQVVLLKPVGRYVAKGKPIRTKAQSARRWAQCSISYSLCPLW